MPCLRPRCTQAGGGAGIGARPSHCRRVCCSGRALPPHATYLFKHALVQDAAYGTLLREPTASASRSHRRDAREPIPRDRREPAGAAGASFHRGRIDRTGRRPVGQSGRAVASPLGAGRRRGAAQPRPRTDRELAATPALRAKQIKLQVALASALFHVKGYTSPETIAAFERADALIEQADALGEHPEGEDALLRFSVLYGQWTGNFSAGNFARAAETRKAVPCSGGKAGAICTVACGPPNHGGTLLISGEFQAARLHLDRAVTLYAPEEHRSLATRFGQDIGVAALVYRSLVLYRLGYPESARVDVDEAVK